MGEPGTRTKFAVVLETDDGIDNGELGGKGASLARLIRDEFPVPSTGVVTASAYRRIAEDQVVCNLIERIGTGAPVPADEVDAVFASVPVDIDLVSEITDIARMVSGGHHLAVRSSATVEDLEGSSFAGQYQSILDVDPGDSRELMSAVRRVWASLWHPAPVAYRNAFAVDDDAAAMAVVLMRMIPAETAGVVFTADPGGTGGSRVEMVEGFGETLVSGERTPSAWVVPADESGSELPDSARRALSLARAVEKRFGLPQDIEWAATDEDVCLVQARPITVLDEDDGFDTPIDDHELTTAGIIEMVPGVLPALRWGLNQFILEEAFRSVLDTLGILRGAAVESSPFVRRVRGRAAIDFDQLRAAAEGIPGAVQNLEEQYFGEAATLDSDVETRPGAFAFLGSWRRQLRTVMTRRQVIEQAEVLIEATRALRRRRPALDDFTEAELLAYARRLVDLAARGLAAELGVAAAGAAAYRRLEVLIDRYLGPGTGAGEALVVTAGAVSVKRSWRSSAAVFAGPTWVELGSQPPERPSADVDSQTVDDGALESLLNRMRSQKGWTARRVLTGQIVDVRLHIVRGAVAEVRDQLHRREAAKAAVLELGGEVRRVHFELGRRFVDRGLVGSFEEVELLTTSEIAAGVAGRPTHRIDQLRRRRNWLSRYEAEGSLPIRFRGVPDREPTPLPEGDVLEGWAASPGRWHGPARVVVDPTDGIPRGAVLVAEATDASWSPLFVRAAAIVVERGGPLSHAAILARELGLPAVLNVAGATQVLDRCLVSVDGDAGVVVIEDRPERRGSPP